MKKVDVELRWVEVCLRLIVTGMGLIELRRSWSWVEVEL